MAMMPWNMDFGAHHDAMERAIDRAFSRAFDLYPMGMLSASDKTRSGALAVPNLFRSVAGTTPMDVHETDKAFTITADAPGFEPSEVAVEEENGVLTVRGQKEVHKEDKDAKGRVVRSERTYRSFSRSFVLPETAQADKIQASLNAGVLSVTVPKTEAPPKPAPRRIQIGGGPSASQPAAVRTGSAEQHRASS